MGYAVGIWVGGREEQSEGIWVNDGEDNVVMETGVSMTRCRSMWSAINARGRYQDSR